MKILKLNIENSSFLFSLLNFKKKENDNLPFMKWFLVYYFGASTLLLLSLHSYFMGQIL